MFLLLPSLHFTTDNRKSFPQKYYLPLGYTLKQKLNTNPTIRTSMDGCLCPPVDFANILHPEAKFTSANGNNRKMEKLFAQGAFSS